MRMVLSSTILQLSHQGGQAYDGNEEAGTTWIEPGSYSACKRFNSHRLVDHSVLRLLTCTVTLSEDAKSGWYQIQGQDKVNLTPGVE